MTRAPLWLGGLLLLVLLVLLGARFTQLDRAPDGFYIDEAAIATQAVCLGQTGKSAQGQDWPLYASVLGGGQASPTLLYPAAAWSRWVGDDIASLRAFSAVHGLLLLLAVAGVLAWQARDGWVFGLVVLLGASSPWWFAHSRLFWDPIIGASWWGLALAAWWAGRPPAMRTHSRLLCWSLAAVAAAAAVYAYPPIRVQLLASAFVILLLDWRTLRLAGWGVLAVWALFALLLGPLAWLYLQDGGFAGRGAMLAIWNPGWLSGQQADLWDLPRIALENLGRHLDPRYLLLTGDSNLRHGSGFGGLLGPVEWTLVLLTLLLTPRFFLRRECWLLLGLVLAGLLGAALTWEGLPHALRSLGAFGPWLLWLGLALSAQMRVLAQMERARVTALLLLVAVLAGGRYGWDYFVDFPGRSTAWFRGHVAPEHWGQEFKLAKEYFRLQQPGAECRPPI